MKPCRSHNVVGCTCTWTRQELAVLKRGGIAMDAAPVVMDWADMFLAAVRKAVEVPFVSDSALRELVLSYRPSKPRKPSCRPRPARAFDGVNLSERCAKSYGERFRNGGAK
jgi:hypothetical protein